MFYVPQSRFIDTSRLLEAEIHLEAMGLDDVLKERWK